MAVRPLQRMIVLRHSVNYHNIPNKLSQSMFYVAEREARNIFSIHIKLHSTCKKNPSITSTEYEQFQRKGILHKLKLRRVTSITVPDYLTEKVTLIGCIETFSKNEKVYVVDGYGRTLCIVPKENHELKSIVKNLRRLDVVSVSGSVISDPSSGQKVILALEDISVLFHSDNNEGTSNGSSTNAFSYRSHTCGDLRPENVGQKVTLCGWLQFQRMSKFLLLRDAYGLVQCILPDQRENTNIPTESVLKVEGTVVMRPSNMINHSMITGDIEVMIDRLEILNMAENIPFTLRQHQKPKEQLRLQHRYLDLRFPEMQNNLRLRSQMLHRMRSFLIEKYSFVEVETPTLFCRTPGGAREFVVPTRHDSLFYSLVQSPQQFKQMLMVGGLDRYFQVARCYRDETTRPDRQPEFTQLDIELSFSNVDCVLDLIEKLIYFTYPVPVSKPPFQRITYKDALETYGSDKPDVSYSLKLNNVTSCIDNINGFASYAIALPKELEKLSRKTKEDIKCLKKQYPSVQNVNYHKLNNDVQSQLFSKLQLDGHESIVLAMGPNDDTCLFLGEIRTLIAREARSKGFIQFNERAFEPLWIVDFPLFLKGENGELETCHHPFTAPHPADLNLLDSEPLKVRSLAYDLVINGNEVGGGSVRVHDAEMQLKLLRMLDIDPNSMGHFVRALRSGCPPHAGIALGIDRMMAQACGAESIRDVIAFPKSHEGKDPLSGAPNAISEDDRQYYHLNFENKSKVSNQ